MPLEFIQHEDVEYARAPLKSVVCQIKFSPVLSLTSQVGVAGFQEAIRHIYPNLNRENSADFQVGGNVIGVEQRPPVWRFTDETKNWAVGIAVDFLSLEVTEYSNFGDFLVRMQFVMEALARTIHPSPSTRIGLRKINELKHDDVHQPLDWVRHLRPELLGLVAVTNMPAPVTFALSDIRFQDDTNYLAVRHGLHPDPAEWLTYLLDLDYFTDRPFNIGNDDGICSLIQYFSDGITNFFHWALQPEFLASFGPRPRTNTGVN